MRASDRPPRRTSAAVVLYVIILVAFQVFLITVAVEAFQTDEESLAWATAAVSVVLAARVRRAAPVPAAMTTADAAPAPPPRRRDALPRLLRARHGDRHHRHRRRPAGPRRGWPSSSYVIAAVAYVVLVVLCCCAWLARFPRRLAGDLTSHAKGFAFLTVVAATNVLGSASGVIHGWWGLAWALWWVSLGLWARARSTAR